MFEHTHLEGWSHLPFFEQSLPQIEAKLTGTHFLPPPQLTFRALELCPAERTKLVILGQDPYHTPDKADGLAFSIDPKFTGPLGSLGNIHKELHNDLGIMRTQTDLGDWAAQGVLLLNTALSVPTGQAGGHKTLGWSELVKQVLQHLSHRPCAFLLWGKHAQAYAHYITSPPSNDTQKTPKHLIIHSAHPSPLSAYRGFFGSSPFSRINTWLKTHGTDPIIWG